LIFLGREIAEQRNYSEKVAEEIDEEVRQIIDQAYQRAKKVLSENQAKLEQLAKRIMEDETIEGEALEALFKTSPGEEPAPTAPEATPVQPEGAPKAKEKGPLPKPVIGPPQPDLA
jgi:cell division protease FtsH